MLLHRDRTAIRSTQSYSGMYEGFLLERSASMSGVYVCGIFSFVFARSMAAVGSCRGRWHGHSDTTARVSGYGYAPLLSSSKQMSVARSSFMSSDTEL